MADFEMYPDSAPELRHDSPMENRLLAEMIELGGGATLNHLLPKKSGKALASPDASLIFST
jgi:hypothetical protein